MVGFTLLYGFLAVIDVYLLTKYAKKGPEEIISEMKSSSAAQEG